MILLILTTLTFTIQLAFAGTSTSYQYVSFVNKQKPPPPPLQLPPRNPNARPTRSFNFPLDFTSLAQVWPETLFIHDNTLLDVDLGPPPGHLIPEFSTAIEYPDPLLLTGLAAKRAAHFLYGRGELFFNNIPHIRALMRLQQERVENGLPPNRLGSLRLYSPFHRNDPKFGR